MTLAGGIAEAAVRARRAVPCVVRVLIVHAALGGVVSSSPSEPPPPKEAATAFSLDAILAKPVSPGRLALLIPYVKRNEAAAARVIEALSHPDRRVRATAARVSNVAGLVAAGPRLREVLASEADRGVASEQLRAAVALARPEHDLALLEPSRRLGLAGVLLAAIAGMRGPSALVLMGTIRGDPDLRAHQAPFLSLATRQGREGLNVASVEALRAGDVAAFRQVLSLARQPGRVLAPGMIVAGLGSTVPGIRTAARWAVLMMKARGSALPPELQDGPAGPPPAVDAAPSEDLSAAFLAELERRLGGGRPDDWSSRLRGLAEIDLPSDFASARDVIGLLTKDERKACSLRMTGGESDSVLDALPKDVVAQDVTGRDMVWIAYDLPPGLVEDLVAVSGCTPGPDVAAAASVVYGAGGRPRQITIMAAPDAACERAATAALALALGPAEGDPSRVLTVIARLDPAVFDCAEAEAPLAVPLRPGGKITEPRKVRETVPRYPESAKRAGVSGAVVLEATISTSGCISSVVLLHGATPDLNAEAARAVSAWRYTPTLIEGRAVPVIMTITVSFRLR